jgi:hypothetical protein
MSEPEQGGVLSRWSRRKLQAEEVSRNEEIALPQAPAEIAGDLVAEAESAEPVIEPVLSDADMPPIESLGENSDFSGFMSSGVSDKLRNLALRKMFQAPSFNIRDGLDEYDEDYTSFEKLGDIVTCDMKHQIEMQELKKKEEAEKQAELDRAEEEASAIIEPDESPEASDLEENPEPDEEDQMEKNDAIQ